MAKSGQRPLSPHLSVYRWGPHMLISILHRATGDGMAIVGGLMLTWWLCAAASGSEAYANFQYYVWSAGAGDIVGLVTNIIGRIVLIGLSWAFCQHLLSGLRHLVMDMGAGYELQTNRFWSKATLVGSVIATIALWVYLFVGRA